MPLFTSDAIILRTYKLAEADRIVVFLTRDRGKKRGVAPRARRPRSQFGGALESLTEARVAYYEREHRELVQLNYAEPVQSPLRSVAPEALAYCQYFAELIDAMTLEADADERLFRLVSSVLGALAHPLDLECLARYVESWVLRLQGIYPSDLDLSPDAAAFVDQARRLGPLGAGRLCVPVPVLREIERCHRLLLSAHLDRELKSVRVLGEMKQAAL